MTILLVIAILVFLIVVHELGHFAAAKFFKIKVEEFGVGYPPRAFSFGVWGGTEYTLNWIPFGGFVRLFGENGILDGKGPKVKGSFVSAKRYAQAIVLVAGVTMNALAAWLLFAGALAVGVPHAVLPENASPTAKVVINTVVPDSPAALAGLAIGDTLVALKDEKTGETPVLVPQDIISFVQARAGKPVELTYRRAAVETTLTIHPAHAVIESQENKAALGVGLVLVDSAPIPIGTAIVQSFFTTIDKCVIVAQGLVQLFADAFSGNTGALKEVVGPIGLVGVVDTASQHGFGRVLELAGFISINLAIINLLPIPALDGGRLVLVGIEALLRRSAPAVGVHIMNTIGVVFILLLMVAVTYNDIARLFT